MFRKILTLALFGAALFSALLAGCQTAASPEAAPQVSQATRSAASTRQAELNQVQAAAYQLEARLDEDFSDHFVGVEVVSEPQLKVMVYLKEAEIEDLTPFVEDARLLPLIEVRSDVVSRQELRLIREAFKAEMDRAGVTYTTGIKLNPARLEVYVRDLPAAREKLGEAGVAIPEHVEFVEREVLPEGG